MSVKEKTSVSGNDIVKWTVIVALTVATVVVQFYYVFPVSVKAMIWIGWALVSGFVFFTTEKGSEAFVYFRESRTELRKVVWPSKQETVQMTITIMVVVAIVSLILWAVDSGLMWMVGKVTQLDR